MAGFRDAQVRLVAAMGNDVTFHFPSSAAVYPPGTAIDPETMKPLDPMVEPTSFAGPPPITIRATVVDRLGMGRDYGDLERAGLIPQGSVILRLPTAAADFDDAIVYARQFEHFDQTYRIIRFWIDGDANVSDRMMVVGELVAALDPNLFEPPPAQQVAVGGTVTEVYEAVAGQTIFPTQLPFIVTSTEVFLDGVRMANGVGLDYIESGQAVVFDEVTNAGQRVLISYNPDT